MKNVRVGLLLTVTIFVMAVIPLLAAFYLLENALRTSLDLGFNPQIVRVLDTSAENLRELGGSTMRVAPVSRAIRGDPGAAGRSTPSPTS